ncbi:MAG TPA: SPOR domain-containing protein [Sphingomicrobium sp.]|nr:SPOR domain-containing protein [Sphingomicrobium sp.]
MAALALPSPAPAQKPAPAKKPALAKKDVRAGIEAWQRADYGSAVSIWRPLAEKGDADAAFNLGQAYRLGRGVQTDLAIAQSWFEKAAKSGHLDAQTTLGLLLFDRGSREAAMRWLKQAADKGEARAMLVYGTALFNGDGVKRDPVLAYAYVSQSAAQGLALAKSTLQEMDSILSVEERRKGVAIALDKAKAKAGAKAPAKPAATAVSALTGKWRVQLGAFSKRSSAEALYARLSGAGPLAGRVAYYVPAGGVTRLQVGPFQSRAAAAAACSRLSSTGQACFPVEGK